MKTFLACFFLLFGAAGFGESFAPNPPTLCSGPDAASCPPPLPEVTEFKKWNPGHYMQLLRNGANTRQSSRFSEYDKIANNSDFVGVFTPWRWSQLEGSNKGDYTNGIKAVRDDIAYLKSLPSPKHFILKIIDFDYGNVANEPEKSIYFPQYLRDQGLVYQGKNAVGWCRWQEQAMNHYIDMLKAYADAFDDEPYFEGIILYKETAPTRGGEFPCSYSNKKYFDQTVRMVRAIEEAFAGTNVLLSHNYLGNQSWSDQLVGELSNAKVGISGPDVLPPSCANGDVANEGTWGYRSLRGDDSGSDFRGVIPSIWSIENSEMGGPLGSCTPAELGAFANQSLKASHLGWDRNTFRGDISMQWESIKAYVADPANQLDSTQCPIVYADRCKTEK